MRRPVVDCRRHPSKDAARFPQRLVGRVSTCRAAPDGCRFRCGCRDCRRMPHSIYDLADAHTQSAACLCRMSHRISPSAVPIAYPNQPGRKRSVRSSALARRRSEFDSHTAAGVPLADSGRRLAVRWEPRGLGRQGGVRACRKLRRDSLCGRRLLGKLLHSANPRVLSQRRS